MPALIRSGEQDPMKAEAEGREAFLVRDSFAGCCYSSKQQDGDEDEDGHNKVLRESVSYTFIGL